MRRFSGAFAVGGGQKPLSNGGRCGHVRRVMRIAVISDTHDRFPSGLPQRIKGADEIWHLGDVCAPDTLVEFEQLGPPLRVVAGNCDAHPWPLTLDLESARRAGMEAQQLRAAANAPIQGSSADIIKLAMVQLHAALATSGLPARLLLQVHDELVLEAEPTAMPQVRELVQCTLEQAVTLTVPLLVETGVGPNWMEAK